MLFDDVQAAHKFYKDYAHNAGFSVRTGQHRCDDNGVVRWKRFLCARASYKTNDSSKKMHRTRETRCGCGAYIYIKRNNEGKYEIAALNEGTPGHASRHQQRCLDDIIQVCRIQRTYSKL